MSDQVNYSKLKQRSILEQPSGIDIKTGIIIQKNGVVRLSPLYVKKRRK